MGNNKKKNKHLGKFSLIGKYMGSSVCRIRGFFGFKTICYCLLTVLRFLAGTIPKPTENPTGKKVESLNISIKLVPQREEVAGLSANEFNFGESIGRGNRHQNYDYTIPATHRINSGLPKEN